MIRTKSQKEYHTLLFSFSMIIALMICSLVFNELTESNIIEVDAGSYVISAIIGLVTIYISKLKDRPKDEDHPLGFSGYVPILNLIRSFMIILICIKAIGESLGSIYSGPPETDHKIMFSYALITSVFNMIAFFIINHKGKQLDSALLKTDALEWKTDIAFNISIILAIVLSYGLTFTSFKEYGNYIDPVFCIVFSIAMAYSPVMLFSENVKLLSVSSIDKELQQQVIRAFKEKLSILEQYQAKFTVLHIGGVLWVNIELEVPVTSQDITRDYLIIKTTGEGILNQITPDNKISFLINRIKE
jgi:divalent metal cation (Fe/Co/Zn/Cd) transporter